MKALLFATTSLLLLAASGTAQTPAPGSFAASRAPGLWINREVNQYQPMELQAAAVDIKVRGHLATTTVELTFYNPNSRVMEGEFVFPLDEGQTVSGYALEVEGKMRQAVIVEKQRGRAIFEEIVRRGIDPGLAELTRGNVFRTRVYPIFAEKTKRVSVTFEQELKADGDTFRYALPMFIPGKLKTYRTHVEVVRAPGVPFTRGNACEPLEFKRQRNNQSQVAEFTKVGVEMWRPLEFHVPKRDDRTQIFLVEDKAKPSQQYFHARVEPPIPLDAPPPVFTPKRVAIFYDASGSAARRLRARELEMLDAWLKRLGTVKVDLVIFRNEAEKPIAYDIKDGETAAVREAMESAALDGGTSLGAVDIRVVPEADAVVLMSDGFSTFSADEPVVTRPDGSAPPLFAIHAAKQADAANLQRLARKTGGQVLNLMRLEVDAAVASMRIPPVRLLQWQVISGKVDEVAIPRQELEDGALVIAGKVQGRSVVELSLGRTSDAAVKHRLTLEPEEALDPASGAFVRRAWAQCRLAELSVDAKRHESGITALGKEHRIVTPGTSLIVLERIEDYARHRLEPVEPDLRAKYLAFLKSHPYYGRERDMTVSTGYVVHQWQEFKTWHEKRHPWLESVIKGAAEHEAALYEALAAGSAQGLPGPMLKAEDAVAAAALAHRAGVLAEQWQEASKEDDSRAAWLQDAAKVLRAVRALRQQRMNLAGPGGVSAAGGGFGFGGGGGFGRGVGIGGSNGFAGSLGDMNGVFTGTMTVNGSLAMDSSMPVEAPASRAATGARDKNVEAEGLEVKPWEPDTPYLTRLRKSDEPVQEYLSLRNEYATSPAFFTDCAGYFFTEKKDATLALRVLSNLAELDLENATLLRTLAFHLKQHGRHDLAALVYEEVLRIRGEEPQSRRDLALCLAQLQKPDFSRAVRLLWEVVTRPWDQRFYGIQLTALHELNDLVQHIPKEQMPDLKALGVDETLLTPVPVALRVVLSWDTDNVDVNFWVIDPAGEVCFVGVTRTNTGGCMSARMSRGYGPEVFTIRRPLPGKYTVLVACQGNYQQKASLPPTVQLEFQSGFNEVGSVKRELITRRLEKMYDAMEVGTFSVKVEDLAAE
ncbi:vault protein inter-alpha-trypsin-like protein [Roseimicrobium gellanilyticum]|uniref:Vault protein inter-alpha-trypsin-like protein n=1 Tax=Roseimicrobium gellanilyticum TaxID=748857 RepID=A0A366HLZ5_9BACT|nr:VIT domain-containing protein [Roseimicrobium gellanilyticum]RBP43948.1 vault protein inter-alpha-trypsin-like protein [Roseimicrobium gellanilyticum]